MWKRIKWTINFPKLWSNFPNYILIVMIMEFYTDEQSHKQIDSQNIEILLKEWDLIIKQWLDIIRTELFSTFIIFLSASSKCQIIIGRNQFIIMTIGCNLHLEHWQNNRNCLQKIRPCLFLIFIWCSSNVLLSISICYFDTHISISSSSVHLIFLCPSDVYPLILC